MADQKFQAGDTVRLKSGGPNMTILHLGNGRYSCIYFHEGKFHGMDEHLWFEEVLLEKIRFDSMMGWTGVK
jgi:uncharacterized protein YodC (DUF2158 family)